MMTPFRFDDLLYADVVMLEMIGIIQDGAEFGSDISLVKARMVKAYAGSYSEGDEVVFMVLGNSERVFDNLPITAWQKRGSRFLMGLEKYDSINERFGYGEGAKNMLLELGFNDYVYIPTLAYVVVAVDGVQYARSVFSEVRVHLWEGLEEQIIGRAGNVREVDRNARNAVKSHIRRNAVAFEIVSDDAAVVTLEAWEAAFNSFTPEERAEAEAWRNSRR
jgi:hypothetical protein